MSLTRRFDTLRSVETGRFTLNVAALHLFLAGVTNVGTGGWLWYFVYSDRLLSVIVNSASWYVTKATALRQGRLLVFLATDFAQLVSVLLVLVGFTGCVVAWEGALRRRSWRRSLLAGACNAWNPLASPLALIGIVLVAASRTEFGPESERTEN